MEMTTINGGLGTVKLNGKEQALFDELMDITSFDKNDSLRCSGYY